MQKYDRSFHICKPDNDYHLQPTFLINCFCWKIYNTNQFQFKTTSKKKQSFNITYSLQ